MKTLFAIVLSAGVAASSGTFAQGVPVIDASALANQKQQFAQEIAQLVKEYEQAVQLYSSINGATDMGDVVDLLNDPDVREILGQDAQKVAAAFDFDLDDLSGSMAGTAQQFEQFTSLDGGDIAADDFYAQELARIRSSTSRKGAIAERTIDLSDDRLEGLERLRQQIGSVSTQKEVDALNARIGIEQAMLQNDVVRVQGMAMLQDAQVEAEERRATEITLQESQQNRDIVGQYFGD
ncbi:type IV secretion system protein [Pseudooceanicola sp. CBS1P-1]|uniref:Type IV secretion system family protein n=1 Tax=Pseudooceanicola albus TaxID=2692189 RepID=A0A6L7G625_9RHOB|nr:MULTISPECIES: type IV secretion system protein [Pseudooceanicola]MBT9385653.1 type IV secretion system protein [Pseudooceanicola endophyticus]MXN18938.1 type IV secretion system family protein [Pseudooceanicola albus]